MACLCARLNEHDLELLRLLFALFCGHLSFVTEIGLVADQDDNNVIATFAADVVDPFRGIEERLLAYGVVSRTISVS